jgi:selenocysteine lyase/cysteine desulfurase
MQTKSDVFAELERAVYSALETYSNVNRGSGYNSMVTTQLYEQARDIVLEYLGLKGHRYAVIFCTPVRAQTLESLLKTTNYRSVSSRDIGLPLGIRALAVDRKALPKGAPFQTGGGTTKLVSKEWVIWADTPGRFEAGTPAIINVITFARALRMTQQYGRDVFMNPDGERLSAGEILFHDKLEKYSGRELLSELRRTLIGRDIIIPTTEGSKPFINLDNSASTPTFEPIWETVCQTWQQTLQIQREIIGEVKSVCSKVLGAPLTDYDMIFTSNTTEAINLAALSLSRENEAGAEPVIINTSLEHSSNDLPWRMIPGYLLIRLPVSEEGFIDLNELETLLNSYNIQEKYGKKRIRLVAVSGASNVIGVCNNILEISRIVHRYGARLLVDAAQLVAHRRIGMELCSIDYLAFSAHKVYAPFGSGMLIVRKGLLRFSPEELELINSSGEENSVGIAALGKALLLLQRIGMDLIMQEEQALTWQALLGLQQINGISLYGITDPESPGFSSRIGVVVFSIKNMIASQIARKLAEQGAIGVRYGCHCAHIMIKQLLKVPPSLEKFQWLIVTLFPALRLPGLVRISFGIENSKEDIEVLIRVLHKIAPQAGSPESKHSSPPESQIQIVSRKEVQKQMDRIIRISAQKIYD